METHGASAILVQTLWTTMSDDTTHTNTTTVKERHDGHTEKMRKDDAEYWVTQFLAFRLPRAFAESMVLLALLFIVGAGAGVEGSGSKAIELMGGL
jgi:hypothetical protein